MIELVLIGIGAGAPDHLTRQGAQAINAADLILIPRKGAAADLADQRRALCAAVLENPSTIVAEFAMPTRDGDADYAAGVDRWHDAVAAAWERAMAAHLPGGAGRVALLVWGDPSLYDSTLRIAGRLAARRPVRTTVVPGVTALQALTAAHAIPLNTIGAPVVITTGRRLDAAGWPAAADTVAVLLDGGCAFQRLDPGGVTIWWGAYLGLPWQLLEAGPLATAGPRILALRAAARAERGWIMDTYLLRRAAADAP